MTILNLHRISTEINPFYPPLTPQLFDELLKYISKEFNIITFREIEQYRNSKKPNIILSFDDDFYEYAMPILSKYKVCVNQNIIVNCVETGKPVWDVMLGDFLKVAPIELVNNISLPNFHLKLSKSNKTHYALVLTHYLKQMPKEKRDILWCEFDNAMQKVDVKFTKMLAKEDIIEIAKFHEIGAHSYYHESMALQSQQYFENDFLACQYYFKTQLNLLLDIYTFPNGSYRNEQCHFLEANGIKYIVLVDEKYSTYDANKYTRFTYYADSVSEIKMRAVGFKL